MTPRIASLLFTLTIALYTAESIVFVFYAEVAFNESIFINHARQLLADGFRDIFSHPAYSILLAGWFLLLGKSLVAARILSLLITIISIHRVYKIGCSLADDSISGAGLCISFLLFPAIVYTLSAATPHALTVLLFVTALSIATHQPSKACQEICWRPFAFGLTVVVVSTIHPLGLPGAVGLIGIYFYFHSKRDLKQLLLLCLVLLILGSLFIVSYSAWPKLPADENMAASGFYNFIAAIIFPYAMLWIGLVLGVVATFSASLRMVMPHYSIALARLCLACFCALLIFLAWRERWEPAQLTIGLVGTFPFAIIAVLPMVVWIRKCMPKIRSMIVWIIIPVVMYICFWAVLGPIGPDVFPLNRLNFSYLSGGGGLVSGR